MPTILHTENPNYNSWFEQEFGVPATTQQEREAVALYGPEMVYHEQGRTSTTPVPSVAVSPQPAASPVTALQQPSSPNAHKTVSTPVSFKDYVALVDHLKVLDFAYYQQASPLVTDDEYEALKFQCQLAETLHPEWVLPDSPTRTIGNDTVNGLPRVAHRTPMLSLQKCSGITEEQKRESLRRWYDRTAKCKQLAIEYKYDGNSVSLVYQNGTLIEASTRGEDGTRGSLITPQVAGLPSIPTTINASGRVEVRGELFIPDARYEELSLCERAKTQQAQVRKVLEQIYFPSLSKEQGFEFRAFDVIMDGKRASRSHTSRMEWAISQGFIESPIYHADSFDALLSVIASMENQRAAIGIPTDGIVIKLDHDDDRENFGTTAHHPKWAIAYKYAATMITVTITNVTATATGKPCLHFEPFMLNGLYFDHIDVKSADYQHYAFYIGEPVTLSLKPGSSSLQFVGVAGHSGTTSTTNTTSTTSTASTSSETSTTSTSSETSTASATSTASTSPTSNTSPASETSTTSTSNTAKSLLVFIASMIGVSALLVLAWETDLLIPIAIVALLLSAIR